MGFLWDVYGDSMEFSDPDFMGLWWFAGDSYGDVCVFCFGVFMGYFWMCFFNGHVRGYLFMRFGWGFGWSFMEISWRPMWGFYGI